ncbi:MAG: glutathione-disulfide reductase [Halomonadaceae bacterium]|nr:MAG: glutathione-disulfide reductase [Halomonadaceae bacterium]
MSDPFQYDLIVIGAGSGGVRLARTAAARGARVAIVESRYLGGTCVNVGCVPKKLFVYASHVREELEDAGGYGFSVPDGALCFDWGTLVANKDREIERLNGIYGRLLDNAGVTLINGTARVTGPQQVTVGDQHYSAERIAVAVGGWPVIPDVSGSEHVLTSNDMFYLKQLPASAVVWGGGYIAVEFASILAGLGVNVRLIHRGDRLLRGFDDDVRDFVADEMRKKGVEISLGHNIQAVTRTGDLYTVTLENGESEEAGMLMAATGRKPLLAGLGLDALDLTLNEDGSVKVNDQFQTSVPSIYALGDVIGTPQLTPIAIAQAMVLSRNLFGDGKGVMHYDNIPTAVFCQPSIGTVGLTEAQARERHGAIRIYRTEFKPMKHTLSGRDERILMKLIVDDASDRVVGAHMVGPEAGEMMQGIAVAMKAGATKADFDDTVGIHPTSAEEFVTLRELHSR